jgi:DNA ligase-1
MSNFKPHKACDVNWDTLKFPCWTMPKIDGVRMLNVGGKAVGRSLKPYKNKMITAFYSQDCLDGLDGEMTANGLITSPSLCRDTTSIINTILGDNNVVWYIFDYVPETLRNSPYKVRYNRAKEVIEHANRLSGVSLKIIPYTVVNNIQEAQEFYEKCLSEKFEGAIYRNPEAAHKSGRCTEKESAYVRAKPSSDKEAIVLELVEAQENLNEAKTNELGYTERSSHKENKVGKGMVGSFICQDVTTGATITVGAGKATHEERIAFWNNPDTIVGKYIKYLSMDTGVKDAPRFARFICIRSEEDMSSGD